LEFNTVVYLLFSPNYGLEVDLSIELAVDTATPENIEQFWYALNYVNLSQNPAVEGLPAVRLPARLLNVPPEIQEFWLALRPAMVTIMKEHPTLVGKREGYGPRSPPLLADHQIVYGFSIVMDKIDPETGLPRWQSFERRRNKEDSYAIWVLREFFDYCTGPGFAI
jgi:hypothetical protein